jgi:hypothetical protein
VSEDAGIDCFNLLGKNFPKKAKIVIKSEISDGEINICPSAAYYL